MKNLCRIVTCILSLGLSTGVLADSEDFAEALAERVSLYLKAASEAPNIKEKVENLSAAEKLVSENYQEFKEELGLEEVKRVLEMRIEVLNKVGFRVEGLINQLRSFVEPKDLNALQEAIDRLEMIKKDLSDASPELIAGKESKLANRCLESAKEAETKANSLKKMVEELAERDKKCQKLLRSTGAEAEKLIAEIANFSEPQDASKLQEAVEWLEGAKGKLDQVGSELNECDAELANRCQERAKEAETKADSLKKRAEELAEQNKKCQELLSSTGAEAKELIDKITNFSEPQDASNLPEAINKLESIKDRLNQASSELSECNAELAKCCQESAKEAETKANSLRKRAAELAEQNKKCQKLLRSTGAEAKELIDKITNFSEPQDASKLPEAINKLESIKDRLNQASSELSECNAELANHCQESAKEAETKADSLKKRAEELAEQNQKCQELLSSTGAEAKELIDKITNFSEPQDASKLQEAIEWLESAKGKLDQVSSKLNECDAELANRCQENAKEAETKADSLKKRAEELAEQNQKCQELLSSTGAEAKELIDKITNFSEPQDASKLQEAVEWLEGAKGKLDQVGSELNECDAELANHCQESAKKAGEKADRLRKKLSISIDAEESNQQNVTVADQNFTQNFTIAEGNNTQNITLTEQNATLVGENITVTDQNVTQNFTTAKENSTQNVTIADQQRIADNAIKLAEEKIEELIPLLTNAAEIHSQVVSESKSYYSSLGIHPMLQHRINWSQFKVIKKNLIKNNIWYREVYRSQYLVDTVDLLEKLLADEELGATFFKGLTEYVREGAKSNKPILPAVQFLLNQGYDNNITQVEFSADELEFMNLTKGDFSARSDLMNAIIKVAKGFNRGCFHPIDESPIIKELYRSVPGYEIGFALKSNVYEHYLVYKQYLRRVVHGFIYSCYDAESEFKSDDIKVSDVWESIQNARMDADNEVRKSAEEVLDFINKAIDEAKMAEVMFEQRNNKELAEQYAMKAEQLRVLSTVVASVNNVGICSILNQGDRLDLLEAAHEEISGYYAGVLLWSKVPRISFYVGGAIFLGVSLPNVLRYLAGVDAQRQVMRMPNR